MIYSSTGNSVSHSNEMEGKVVDSRLIRTVCNLPIYIYVGDLALCTLLKSLYCTGGTLALC